MKRSHSPAWAAAYAEAQACARLHRERALNDFIASQNPHLPSTARYRRGALPSWHPRFYSRADYLSYLARREMGRFDDEVTYPTREDT